MTTKKYTLYSASGDDGPRPCAFFASPAGCRNGDKCKFHHGKVPSQTTPASAAAKIPESDSSVSSESDEEMEPPPPIVEKKKLQKKKKEKPKDKSPKRPASEASLDASDEEFLAKKQKNEKKRRTSEVPTEREGQNPFAAPKKASASSSSVENDPFGLGKKQKAANGASTPKSAAKAKTPKKAEEASAPTAAPSSKKKTKRENKSKQTTKPTDTPAAPATASYLNLNLPIASFSIPMAEDTVTPTKKKEKVVTASDSDEGGKDEDSGSDSDAPQHKPVSKDIKSAHQHPALPLPASTEEGRKWKDAVIQTRAHDRYEASFDFERYKENEPDGVESWIKAKPYGQWCTSNPPAIAIDCEMCETRDPVTGVNDAKALCRISVVNAVNPDEVLLDTLVKPAWPVVDYRTRINGIKAEHLETVQFTLRHAQAFMMALCSEETVITGHAVHNDLVALKMQHHCNADSAFLFSVKDEPGATPSLKDLAMAVMGKAMPNTHDSVNDARTALLCLKDYLEKDGNVEPITRSFPRRNRGSTGGASSSDHLLVHRIPRFCKPDHITQMLLAHTFVQPKEVGEIEFSGATGKVHVYFASERHAKLAFQTLSGEEKPDKTGRSQKKVYLRNGDYVQVRSSVKKRALI
mmetsp:Transcript_2336/g.6797  ORF Transcript_2336/g.6797 Transcript_2336/m.6797 type:complete len:635 (-) Transcript_2336:100-2004(-)